MSLYRLDCEAKAHRKLDARREKRATASVAPELDIEGILEALVEANVFLLIGGVAVGFHGYVRATKDVDVVPSPDPENLGRLAGVLEQLGAEVEGSEEFEDAELPLGEALPRCHFSRDRGADRPRGLLRRKPGTRLELVTPSLPWKCSTN